MIADDLREAARFLMDDGYSIDTDEAVRIGLNLCELAGVMRQAERDDEKEPK